MTTLAKQEDVTLDGTPKDRKTVQLEVLETEESRTRRKMSSLPTITKESALRKKEEGYDKVLVRPREGEAPESFYTKGGKVGVHKFFEAHPEFAGEKFSIHSLDKIIKPTMTTKEVFKNAALKIYRNKKASVKKTASQIAFEELINKAEQFGKSEEDIIDFLREYFEGVFDDKPRTWLEKELLKNWDGEEESLFDTLYTHQFMKDKAWMAKGLVGLLSHYDLDEWLTKGMKDASDLEDVKAEFSRIISEEYRYEPFEEAFLKHFNIVVPPDVEGPRYKRKKLSEVVKQAAKYKPTLDDFNEMVKYLPEKMIDDYMSKKISEYIKSDDFNRIVDEELNHMDGDTYIDLMVNTGDPYEVLRYLIDEDSERLAIDIADEVVYGEHIFSQLHGILYGPDSPTHFREVFFKEAYNQFQEEKFREVGAYSYLTPGELKDLFADKAYDDILDVVAELFVVIFEELELSDADHLKQALSPWLSETTLNSYYSDKWGEIGDTIYNSIPDVMDIFKEYVENIYEHSYDEEELFEQWYLPGWYSSEIDELKEELIDEHDLLEDRDEYRLFQRGSYVKGTTLIDPKSDKYDEDDHDWDAKGGKWTERTVHLFAPPVEGPRYKRKKLSQILS